MTRRHESGSWVDCGIPAGQRLCRHDTIIVEESTAMWVCLACLQRRPALVPTTPDCAHEPVSNLRDDWWWCIRCKEQRLGYHSGTQRRAAE